MLPPADAPEEAFRVGRGYIDQRIHDAEAHWILSADELTALRSLKEAFYDLISRRDSLEIARRAFVPVSPLQRSPNSSSSTQEQLFHATQAFFGQYYKCLTTLTGFVSNFQEAFETAPNRTSMAKFIDWLADYALFSDLTTPLMREAREFRTIFEHPTLLPLGSTWATAAEPGQPARLFFHGPNRSDGSIPPGGIPEPEAEAILPSGHTWVRFGPDEDLALWALAVQLNALLPRCQSRRLSELKLAKCTWKPEFDPESPDGYPVFAIADSIVVETSESSAYAPRPNPPRKLPAGLTEAQQIDYILGAYFHPEDE